VLSRLFRRLFLEKLIAAHKASHLKFFGSHAACKIARNTDPLRGDIASNSDPS
jgi:hypothetical protein